MWIGRDISGCITKNSDVIQIVQGPRQCGKSSLLMHLDPQFHEVTLDDFDQRILAQDDPKLFLKPYENKKLIIDEAQHAPNLFLALKRKADVYKRAHPTDAETIVRLTSSNQILMDKNVKESLAGRASYFDMNTLSVSEVLNAVDMPVQQILYQGGWPELYVNPHHDARKFLNDYIRSYIEKDIVLSAGIQKSAAFLLFMKLLAGRVGNLVDHASLASAVKVDAKTIQDWMSILEKMHVISLVPPYASNLSKRLIKTPKVFFIDTGLACRLQGWSESDPILSSPVQGHLFENLVFSEIHKCNINYQLGWTIYHWRSKDGEEIDFLIQADPQTFMFVEAKVSAVQLKDHRDFSEVKRVFQQAVPQRILCHQEGERILANRIPISMLNEFLLKNMSTRQRRDGS